MRLPIRLALGVLAILPAVGVSGSAPAVAASALHASSSGARSVASRHTPEPAFVVGEPDTGHSPQLARAEHAAVDAATAPWLVASALVALAVAIPILTARRSHSRTRAPPLRLA